MIKYLYETGDLPIEKILSREYVKLGLSSDEFVVLNGLFSNYKKRVFSLNALVKKVNIKSSACQEAISNLIAKGFVCFDLETKDGKTKEVYSLDQTFSKIEDLFKQEQNIIKLETSKSNIKETIEKLEQLKGKSLTTSDFEMIKSWYDNEKYQHDQILKMISLSAKDNSYSVLNIDRLLFNQKELIQDEDNDKDDEILNEIFKQL